MNTVGSLEVITSLLNCPTANIYLGFLVTNYYVDDVNQKSVSKRLFPHTLMTAHNLYEMEIAYEYNLPHMKSTI